MLDINQTKSLHADVRDEERNQKVILHASFGAKIMNLSVEVLDPAYVVANTAIVEADVAEFIAMACQEAAKGGLPTSRVTQG